MRKRLRKSSKVFEYESVSKNIDPNNKMETETTAVHSVVSENDRIHMQMNLAQFEQPVFPD